MSTSDSAKYTEIVNLLDHGFVKLVDFMGGDERVVSSARVSFGAGSKGEAKDKALIKYLLFVQMLIFQSLVHLSLDFMFQARVRPSWIYF
jgi:thymidylate synthase ThyX